MTKKRILVVGAVGQIGSELVPALREQFGNDNVIAGWHRSEPGEVLEAGPTENLDVSDSEALKTIVDKYNIDTVYHLASLLSGVAEQKPEVAWDVNMKGLVNVLELAKEKGLQVFWPSSIAVFGPETPRENAPQHVVMPPPSLDEITEVIGGLLANYYQVSGKDFNHSVHWVGKIKEFTQNNTAVGKSEKAIPFPPATIYGVTKAAGELLAWHYFNQYDVDIRSIRYPGLISWKTPPGGGTTDYAVDIYFKALESGEFTSFLTEETKLPMMYMADAIAATIKIMTEPAENIKIRTSYNVSSMSFTPAEVSEEIKKTIPNFELKYKPDFRQQIADSWPDSIDDSSARKDWNWRNEYDLGIMTKEMLDNIRTSEPVEVNI